MIAPSRIPLSTSAACWVVVLLQCTDFISLKYILLALTVQTGVFYLLRSSETVLIGTDEMQLFNLTVPQLLTCAGWSRKASDSGVFCPPLLSPPAQSRFLLFLQAPAPMAFPMTSPQVPVYGMVSVQRQLSAVHAQTSCSSLLLVFFWFFFNEIHWYNPLSN